MVVQYWIHKKNYDYIIIIPSLAFARLRTYGHIYVQVHTTISVSYGENRYRSSSAKKHYFELPEVTPDVKNNADDIELTGMQW